MIYQSFVIGVYGQSPLASVLKYYLISIPPPLIRQSKYVTAWGYNYYNKANTDPLSAILIEFVEHCHERKNDGFLDTF